MVLWGGESNQSMSVDPPPTRKLPDKQRKEAGTGNGTESVVSIQDVSLSSLFDVFHFLCSDAPWHAHKLTLAVVLRRAGLPDLTETHSAGVALMLFSRVEQPSLRAMLQHPSNGKQHLRTSVQALLYTPVLGMRVRVELGCS